MKPGDIGLTPSGGFIAKGIRLVTRGPYAHAFLSVDGGDVIVEGDPHGVRYNRASAYDGVVWLTCLSAALSDRQRQAVVGYAVAHLGTPYSWLDDAEIALVDVFGWAPRRMRNRLRSDRTLMCSQLCDAAFHSAGVDLFADGRPAGGVSPNDLWRLESALRRVAATHASSFIT